LIWYRLTSSIMEIWSVDTKSKWGVGVRARVPAVGGDVVLAVLAGLGVKMFEQSLRRPDEGEPDALYGASRVKLRGNRAG
jgi:hypothetical protein